MRSLSSVMTRFATVILLAFGVINIQFMFVAGTAHAAEVCTTDSAGVDDEAGLGDLAEMCVDAIDSPLETDVAWSWDETSLGSESLEACALVDTDKDGNADEALCVEAAGDPVAVTDVSIYRCADDDSPRHCANPVENTDPYDSTCDVAVSSDDTVATCVLMRSDLSTDSTVEILDVCTYESQQLLQQSFDCVRAHDGSAIVEAQIDLNPSYDPGLFNLSINSDELATDVGHKGATGETVVDSGQVTVEMEAGTDTNLLFYLYSVECRDQNGTGSVVASGQVSSVTFDIDEDDNVWCVFSITLGAAQVTLIMLVENVNGGTASADDFSLFVDGIEVQSGNAQNVESTKSSLIDVQGIPDGYNIVSIVDKSGGDDCPAQLGLPTVELVHQQALVCEITASDRAPELAIDKSVANAQYNAGETISYTLDYDNIGDLAAENARLVETVPTGTTFAGTSGWSCTPDNSAGSSCEYALGDLDTNSPGSVQFEVVADSVFSGTSNTVSNTALMLADNAYLAESSVDTEVVAEAVLGVTKDGDVSSVSPGEQIVYNVSFDNQGSTAANNIRLVETVPDNTSYVGSGEGWSCADVVAGSTCTNDLGTIAAGSSASVNFTVEVDADTPESVTEISNTVDIVDDNDTILGSSTETTEVTHGSVLGAVTGGAQSGGEVLGHTDEHVLAETGSPAVLAIIAGLIVTGMAAFFSLPSRRSMRYHYRG